jgi:nicotinamide-nucleotide amidase
MLFDKQLTDKGRETAQTGRAKSKCVSPPAESCTGGLIAALMTEIPGSSIVVGRSFITYSNRAKHEILHVPAELLREHGAVSEPVVRAMAQNTFDMTSAHLTIAVSGIAGPGGGSAEKPAGLVHMATCLDGDVIHVRNNLGILAALKCVWRPSMRRWICC